MAQAPLDPNTDGRAPALNLRLPRARRARLDRIADAKGMSVSAYVRSVLDSAMDADEAPDDQEGVAAAS